MLQGMSESHYLGSQRRTPFTEAEEAEIFAELDKDYISGITFSGGDPLHSSNITEVTALAKRFVKIIRERLSGCTPVPCGKKFRMRKLSVTWMYVWTVSLSWKKGASAEVEGLR